MTDKQLEQKASDLMNHLFSFFDFGRFSQKIDGFGAWEAEYYMEIASE